MPDRMSGYELAEALRERERRLQQPALNEEIGDLNRFAAERMRPKPRDLSDVPGISASANLTPEPKPAIAEQGPPEPPSQWDLAGREMWGGVKVMGEDFVNKGVLPTAADYVDRLGRSIGRGAGRALLGPTEEPPPVESSNYAKTRLQAARVAAARAKRGGPIPGAMGKAEVLIPPGTTTQVVSEEAARDPVAEAEEIGSAAPSPDDRGLVPGEAGPGQKMMTGKAWTVETPQGPTPGGEPMAPEKGPVHEESMPYTPRPDLEANMKARIQAKAATGKSVRAFAKLYRLPPMSPSDADAVAGHIVQQAQAIGANPAQLVGPTMQEIRKRFGSMEQDKTKARTEQMKVRGGVAQRMAEKNPAEARSMMGLGPSEGDIQARAQKIIPGEPGAVNLQDIQRFSLNLRQELAALKGQPEAQRALADRVLPWIEATLQAAGEEEQGAWGWTGGKDTAARKRKQLEQLAAALR